MPFSLHHATALLRKYFHHSAFRNGQEEVVRALVEGRDTLVVMPTGGGKSVCYQLPALMLKGTALVISPLIALMQDQVGALNKLGIRACFINSSLPAYEIRQRLHDARYGKYGLIYIAPERLENKQFLEALSLIQLSFVAVDEAHCISEWGHDFRPAYRGIATAVRGIAETQGIDILPVIALTATATPEVQDDIVRQLDLHSPERFVRGFDRPNLTYTVIHEQQKLPVLADLCSDSLREQGSTIVYCGSRKRVEEFTGGLQSLGISVDLYHGGLPDARRSEVLDRFLQGDVPAIVATNAFGMGVDKPNVRRVVHCDLTLTLEAYYQEAGRAGRDGRSADCTVLYTPKDCRLMEFFLESTYPDTTTIGKVFEGIYNFAQVQQGQKPNTPLYINEAALANTVGVSTAAVHSVLSLFERSGVLRRGSQQGMARVQLLATRERFREYHDNVSEDRRSVLNALVRHVGPRAFEGFVDFDVAELWRKYGLLPERFMDAMRAFENARLVRFEAPGAVGGLTLLVERMPVNVLPVDWQAFEERKERAHQKFAIVKRYAETHACKRNYLLQYFGENDSADTCGKCSSCKNQAKRALARNKSPRARFVQQQVFAATMELDGRFGRGVIAEVLLGNGTNEKVQKFSLQRAATFGTAREFSRQELLEEIDMAIAEGFLLLSADRYPTVHLSPLGRSSLVSPPAILSIHRYQRTECLYPDLYRECQRIRAELAARDQLNEMFVVDDKTLLRFVNALPPDMRAMKKLAPQLGELFFSRYAPLLLRTIQGFIAKEQQQSGTDTEILSVTVRETIHHARQGLALESIAAKRGLALATIAQHLQEALESGIDLSRQQFITDDLYTIVFPIVQRNPLAPLREIRDSLSIDMSWIDLRIASAFARRELRNNHIKTHTR